MSENFAELFEEYNEVELDKTRCYVGKIIEITKSSVFIDSPFKSSVSIPIEEFTKFDKDLKEGEEFDYQIKDYDDGFGQVMGTRKEIIENMKWGYFEKIQDNNETVTGMALKVSAGGLVVRVKEIQCFIPKSLLDIDFKVKADDLVGQSINAKIIKINKGTGGVVLSRKAQIQEERNIEYPDQDLKAGDIVTGVVKNIADFGAFIDLGYKDALLHISEMSWVRVKSIGDVVQEGDKLECKVVNVSQDGKISLSLKSLTENPWNSVKVGDTIPAIVMKKEKYGVICSLENNIEGVINNSNVDPEALEIGEEIKVEVESIEAEKGKMTLKWVQ